MNSDEDGSRTEIGLVISPKPHDAEPKRGAVPSASAQRCQTGAVGFMADVAPDLRLWQESSASGWL